MISDAELAQIEAWGEQALKEMWATDDGITPLTEYTDALPTHSIRSQMLCLSGEVRRLRTALAGLMNAYPISEEHTGFYDDCDACRAVLVGLDVLGVKEQIDAGDPSSI